MPKKISFWSHWAVFFCCFLFLSPKISCLKKNFYITVGPELIGTRFRGSVLKKWPLLLLSGLRKQEKSHFRHLKEFRREGDWQFCTCYLSVEGYQMEQKLFCSLEEHKKVYRGNPVRLFLLHKVPMWAFLWEKHYKVSVEGYTALLHRSGFWVMLLLTEHAISK